MLTERSPGGTADLPFNAVMPQRPIKYVVLHNDPGGLVMSQMQRDLLFSTGNVLGVKECSIHSLQPEFFQEVLYRPLVLILWGMADRYGCAEEKKVGLWEVKSWSEAYQMCQTNIPAISIPSWSMTGVIHPELTEG